MNNIKTFIIDLDGTLTNGQYIVDDNGVISKSFHTLDFFAMNKVISLGYNVLIITQSKDNVIEKKLDSIHGCKINLICGSTDKSYDAEIWLKENNLKWKNVIYIGDSENDIECIKKAGISACPDTIVEEVKDICKIKSPIKGGEGAVYWIIMTVLKELNKWDK